MKTITFEPICFIFVYMSFNVKHLQIYLFFLAVFLFFSCQSNKRPSVAHIKLQLKIERFDRDLYRGKDKAIVETDSLLFQKYGRFYEDFISRMVGTPELSRQEILTTLYRSKPYQDLQQETDSVYPQLHAIENDLTGAFKYILYYYPKALIPRFIAFVSGFAYQIPVGDHYMGIGLDMFLGRNSKFYPALVNSIPRYQSRRFEPSYIVARLTEEYARQELFRPRDEDQTLLSQMIYNGKIFYFMDQVLAPDMNDSLKIGYTGRQLAWCQKFEGNIWGVLLEQELLYKTDIQKIQVYLTDGPFTPGLGDKAESAPRLGVWIGWQIVKKYMEANPEVTIQALMADQDAQKILIRSKYKPKLQGE
ncbi:gliding motility-associated lipoprotein GldB [compost metagenome]